MANPVAFILLDEPMKVDAARLRDSLTARHPGVTVSVSDDAATAAVVLTVSGSVVAVMERDERLPDGWQEVAARSTTQWPEAEAACARHRAHVVVSVMG